MISPFLVRAAGAVLCLLLLTAPRAARGDGGGRTAAVVVALDSVADPERATVAVPQVQRALRARGLLVVRDGAARIEDVHSVPVQAPADDRLAALRAALDAAVSALALGELAQARIYMGQLQQAPERIVDFLNRESGHAREMFYACVTTGYLLHERGRRPEGRAQLARCAERFPMFTLPRTSFTDDVRALYERVRKVSTLLRVEGADGSAAECRVRLNGVSVGSPPLSLRVSPSKVRVQLECGETPGRVHSVDLTSGDRVVTLDPTLDKALDTSGSSPALHYRRLPSEGTMKRQLLALGQTMDVDFVVALTSAGRFWSLRLADVTRAVVGAPMALDGQRVDLAVANLFTPGAPPRKLQTSEVSRAAPPRARSLVGTGPTPVAYYVAIGLLWAAAPVVTGLALDERRNVRREGRLAPSEKYQSLEARYNRAAALSVLGALVPSAVLAASAPFLPEARSVPWVAWMAGAVGLALAGAGFVLAVGPDHCVLGDASSDCGYAWADPLAGPLLILHGAGPLAISLAYIISGGSEATPQRASRHITVQSSGRGLTLGVVF